MKFSKIEKEHLVKAWLAIGFAFSLLLGDLFSSEFLLYFLLSIFTVGLGFLLHELAHKFVAQRYGCFAEFRADDKMLLLTIAMAFFGFLFAAPGAVIIIGNVNEERSGKISIAGPAMNILLAISFLILTLVSGSYLKIASFIGYKTNSFIALFNMLPILNFDGKKILKWNKIVYSATACLALLLTILSGLVQA